jgi:hypothetical protein
MGDPKKRSMKDTGRSEKGDIGKSKRDTRKS